MTSGFVSNSISARYFGSIFGAQRVIGGGKEQRNKWARILTLLFKRNDPSHDFLNVKHVKTIVNKRGFYVTVFHLSKFFFQICS